MVENLKCLKILKTFISIVFKMMSETPTKELLFSVVGHFYSSFRNYQLLLFITTNDGYKESYMKSKSVLAFRELSV